MDNFQYGVATANKFTLVDLDADDPLDYLNVIGEQSNKDKLKLKEQEQQKAKGKGSKQNKTKKNVQQNVTKQESVIQKKEERPVSQTQLRQNDNRPPRSARQSRDSREFRDGENRPPRKTRDENSQNEFRDRERQEGGSGGFSRQDGGFSRQDSGFSRQDGGFRTERGGFRGRGRGGRGRGRGERGGGFGDRGERKREFERHSGSDRTSGVKATDKRDGSGAHNWGTFKDDLDDSKDMQEENKDWNQTAENAENQDPNESTESTEPPAEVDDTPKQMTLTEYKALQAKNRMKSDFNIRRAGEGVNNDQWSKGKAYKKPIHVDEDEDEEDDEEEYEETDHKTKHLITDIRITFNDSPRRGRGGRRPRAGRGSRGGGSGRGERRGGPRESAPKFDDEEDFPSLVKTEA